MKMGPVFFLAVLPCAAHAQTQGSLGLGVGTVRYAGGSSFSAATASPAIEILSPSFYVGGTGALSALPHGVWAAQGRADLWAATPGGRGIPQLAVSVNGAASSRSDGVAAASAYAIGEVLFATGRSGAAFGAGVVGGVIERESSVSSFRLRARAWSQAAATQLSLSAEPTRLLGAWYTDLSASATVDGGSGRVTGSVWVAARVSGTYGSKGAASAALQYYVTPTISLEGGVGSYLNDPFQDLPRAGYVSAGLRFHSAPRRLAPPPPAAPVPAPLVAARRGDSAVVRFRMPGARALAIAGDWTNWEPVSLRGLGDDIWEGAFSLKPGTYHFNLLVDGTEWVVPGGVAAVADGMGGLVAVLTVL